MNAEGILRNPFVQSTCLATGALNTTSIAFVQRETTFSFPPPLSTPQTHQLYSIFAPVSPPRLSNFSFMTLCTAYSRAVVLCRLATQWFYLSPTAPFLVGLSRFHYVYSPFLLKSSILIASLLPLRLDTCVQWWFQVGGWSSFHSSFPSSLLFAAIYIDIQCVTIHHQPCSWVYF